MNLDDVKAVCDIYMSPKVNPYMSFEPMTFSEFEPIINELMQQREYWVWQDEEHVAGVVALVKGRWRGAHRVSIAALAVNQAHHGRGIGRAMMNQLFEYFAENHFSRIELIVESDNPKAITFYQSLGFVHEGTMKNYFKRAGQSEYIDDYLMAKIID